MPSSKPQTFFWGTTSDNLLGRVSRIHRYGSGPKWRLEGIPPPPRSIAERARRLGERGRGKVGMWEGKGWGSSSCNRGEGGDPPKGSLGQTHIWGGGSRQSAFFATVLAWVTVIREPSASPSIFVLLARTDAMRKRCYHSDQNFYRPTKKYWGFFGM